MNCLSESRGEKMKEDVEIIDYTKLHAILSTHPIELSQIVRFKLRGYSNVLLGQMSMLIGVKTFYVVLHDKVIHYNENEIEWWKVIGEYYEQ